MLRKRHLNISPKSHSIITETMNSIVNANHIVWQDIHDGIKPSVYLICQYVYVYHFSFPCLFTDDSIF